MTSAQQREIWQIANDYNLSVSRYAEIEGVNNDS
jgi:hypothetical protein